MPRNVAAPTNPSARARAARVQEARPSRGQRHHRAAADALDDPGGDELVERLGGAGQERPERRRCRAPPMSSRGSAVSVRGTAGEGHGGDIGQQVAVDDPAALPQLRPAGEVVDDRGKATAVIISSAPTSRAASAKGGQQHQARRRGSSRDDAPAPEVYPRIAPASGDRSDGSGSLDRPPRGPSINNAYMKPASWSSTAAQDAVPPVPPASAYDRHHHGPAGGAPRAGASFTRRSPTPPACGSSSAWPSAGHGHRAHRTTSTSRSRWSAGTCAAPGRRARRDAAQGPRGHLHAVAEALDRFHERERRCSAWPREASPDAPPARRPRSPPPPTPPTPRRDACAGASSPRAGHGRGRPHAQHADAHRLRHRRRRRPVRASSGGCWRASWAPLGAAFDMFDGAVARATGTPASSAPSWTAPSTAGARGALRRHRHRLHPAPASTLGAWLAAAAMGSAFMVSYTRARAESLGFSAAAAWPRVGLAPREVRIVILGIGLVGAGLFGGVARRQHRHQHPGVGARAHRRSSPPSRSSNASCSSRQASQQLGGRSSVTHEQATSNGETPASNGPTAPAEPQRAQDPRRHRRRRQLRQQPRPGPLLLRERQGRRLRPGPDARRPGRLPRPRHRVRGRLRHRQEQGRQGPLRGHLRQAEQHLRLPAGAHTRRDGRARHDPRRPGQVPQPDHREGARPDGRRRRHPQGAQGRRHGLLPARGQRGGHQVVRRAGAQGGRRLHQRHPRVHRPRALLAAPLRRGGAARHRRRHQEPGRRHHHATAC